MLIRFMLSLFIFLLSFAAITSQKITFLKAKKIRKNHLKNQLQLVDKECEKIESQHFIYQHCKTPFLHQKQVSENRPDKGLTLVELLVSIGLFSSLLMGVSTLAISDLRFSSSHRKQQVQYEKLEFLALFSKNLIQSGMQLDALKSLTIHANATEIEAITGKNVMPSTQGISVLQLEKEILYQSEDKKIFCQLSAKKTISTFTNTKYWLALTEEQPTTLEAKVSVNKKSDSLCQGNTSLDVNFLNFSQEKTTFLIPIIFSGTIFLDQEKTLRIFEHNKKFYQPLLFNFETLSIKQNQDILIFKNLNQNYFITLDAKRKMSEKEFFIILSKIRNEKI